MIHGCPVTTTGQLGERRCMLAGKSTPRREMKCKLLHTFSEAQLWFKQRQYCQDWSWNNLKKGKCFNKWQSRQCWNLIFTFSEKKWAISDVLIFPLKILSFFPNYAIHCEKKKKKKMLIENFLLALEMFSVPSFHWGPTEDFPNLSCR